MITRDLYIFSHHRIESFSVFLHLRWELLSYAVTVLFRILIFGGQPNGLSVPISFESGIWK